MSTRSKESLAIAAREESFPSQSGLLARWLNLSEQRKKVLFTFATSMAMFGAFAIQGILLAKILGREGRGAYATTVFYPQVLLYAGLLGGVEIVAWFARQTGTDLVRLRRAAFRLSLLTGLLSMLAVVIFSLTCVPESKQYLVRLCLICSIALPFQHIQLVTISVDRGSDRFNRYNWIRLFGAMLLPAILLFIWLAGIGNLDLICLMFVVAAIVSAIPCMWGMRGSVSPAEPPAKELLVRGKSYAASMFASELFERLDIALFFFLTSLGTQGCYAAIVPAAHLLVVIPNALGMFTFNIGADPQRHVSVREASTALLLTFFFQLITTVLFTLVIAQLILFFFGDEFRPAIPLVYALIPAISIKGFLQAVEGYLKGRGKAHIGTWARTSGALIMIVFVYFMFGRFEQEGMSIPLGALVAQCFCMVWILIAVYLDVIQRNREEARA